MNTVTLSPPGSLLHWLQVYSLYRRAFPASERKPFSIIISMYRKKTTDLWCIRRAGSFAGFAATVNSPDTVLLDYLAIEPKYRDQGIGSAALSLLLDRYGSKGLFVEIESTRDPGPDLALRRKRQQFYEAAGMRPMEVTAMVFGVKMDLMGHNCLMDLSAYQAFYRDNYSPWAAEHISPVS